MAQPARRPAAPDRYGEVLDNVHTVEAQLKKLPDARIGEGAEIQGREAIGSAVASLVSRAGSACW